jgi:hypothetical protein
VKNGDAAQHKLKPLLVFADADGRDQQIAAGFPHAQQVAFGDVERSGLAVRAGFAQWIGQRRQDLDAAIGLAYFLIDVVRARIGIIQRMSQQDMRLEAVRGSLDGSRLEGDVVQPIRIPDPRASRQRRRDQT